MPAPFAKVRMLVGAMASRAFGLTDDQRPSCGSAGVPGASRPQSSAGGPLTAPLDVVIAHRAERLCNRNPALVARYVRVQTILSRGACSE